MKKVIIIGGGILGSSTAYHLAKQGIEVTLVDRKDTGQATDAAAGIIAPWIAQRRNKAWYELVRNGAKTYPTLVNELAKDGEHNTGYQKVGALRLHTKHEILMDTKKRLLKRREKAAEIGEISLLDEKETSELFPLVDPIYQSIHITGGARVDGKLLRKALLNAAKKHGTKVIHGDASLVCNRNKVIGVQVDNEIMKADTVVATTGAWMNELFNPLNIRFKARPQKAQIIHLQLKDYNTHNWPVIMPPNNQYILPTTNNKVIIGATHETEAKFDQRITAGGIHEILSKALHIAPQLADGTLFETKMGFRPFTPGSLPVLGPLPGYEGIILANGLGASGLTMGPFIGDQLAKLILGIKLDINLDDYDVHHAIE